MSRDAWWVEYMEGEMDPSLKEDLEFLLKKSKAYRLKLDEMQTFRQWVKLADPVESLWLEERMSKLHKSIMTEVEKIEKTEKKNKGKKKSRRGLWRGNSNRASV